MDSLCCPNFVEANIRRALIELRLCVDSPAQVEREKLVTFPSAITIEAGKQSCLKYFSFLRKIGEG